MVETRLIDSMIWSDGARAHEYRSLWDLGNCRVKVEIVVDRNWIFSYAHIFVLAGPHRRWEFLAEVQCARMQSGKPIRNPGRTAGVTRSCFMDDESELLRLAAANLSGPTLAATGV